MSPDQMPEANVLYRIPNASKYRITKDGRVWSLYLEGFRKDCRSQGYKVVSIKKDDGKVRNIFIHRVLAELFVSGFSKGLQVNHKDGDKLNNDISNLEWVTSGDNTRHALKIGLREKGLDITAIKNRVVPENIAIEIVKEYYKGGITHYYLGNIYGYDHNTIKRIVEGKTRGYIQVNNIIQRLKSGNCFEVLQ